MKPGSWYICGFCVTFVYFYVYAINAIRGEINGPRRGHHPQPPYSRSNRKVALTLVIYMYESYFIIFGLIKYRVTMVV